MVPRPPIVERIAHVDMDAFFVEVERLDDPSLRGRPVAVGGAGSRGVVASASYEARRFGVTSAMPMARARRACPGLVVVPPSHGRYGEVSRTVFETLESFTPHVEKVSVDEAFLDIGGLRLLHDGPAHVADAIRTRMRQDLGLPCSIGVATTRLLAKLASRDAKPDGLLVVPAGSERAYLHPKPVGSLWGVGAATLARLESLGIGSVGDLAGYPRAALESRLGEAAGGMLWSLAQGGRTGGVAHRDEARSVSVEQTYPSDLTGHDRIEEELLRHADRLAGRLRRSGLVAHTIALKVRYDDFTTITRTLTRPDPTATVSDLYEAARSLVGRTAAGRRPVRLLGLAGSGLVDETDPAQLTLGGDRWGSVDEAVEAVRGRFGDDAVERARIARVSRRGSGPGAGHPSSGGGEGAGRTGG
jgi:DNA polymerase-4